MAAVEVTVAKQSSARDDTDEERAGDGPSFASRVSSRIRLPAIGSARPRRMSLQPTSEPPPIGQHPPHSLNESDSTWARSKRPYRDGDAVFAAAETRRLGNRNPNAPAPRGRRQTVPCGCAPSLRSDEGGTLLEAMPRSRPATCAASRSRPRSRTLPCLPICASASRRGKMVP